MPGLPICLTMFLTAGLLAIPIWSGKAHAHALAQRYDLPLPLGFFLAGAGAAVTVSFVMLALFWKHAGARRNYADGPCIHGRVPGAVIVAGQLFGLALLLLVVAAGLLGNPATFKNIAPVAVWVIWWVGFGFFSAFIGNLWPLMNPWSAAFGFAERLAGSHAVSPMRRYPEWLGAWPACALFMLFAWLELIAPARDLPRNVAIAAIIYSLLTWAGFVLFGRDAWLKGGEVFSVVFDLFGRFAPLYLTGTAGPRWGWRPYAAGLRTRAPLDASMTAFTLLVLGTVTVDGFMETPAWAAMVDWFLIEPGKSEIRPQAYMLLQTGLLVAGPLLLAALYLAVVYAMAKIVRSSVAALAGLFVLSLVPIAIAYHLAHYFSLFMSPASSSYRLLPTPWDMAGTCSAPRSTGSILVSWTLSSSGTLR